MNRWSVRLAACLAGLLAAAPGPSARADCLGPLVASLPLLPAGGRSAVPVALNGRSATLIVDTGATHVALAAAAVRSLGLAETSLPQAVASGIGGVPSRSVVDLRDLDLDGIRFPARNIPVIEARMPSAAGDPAAGVLGTSVLSRFDVELDLAEARMRLFLHAACAPEAPPWAGRWSRLPLAFEPSNLEALIRRGDVVNSATWLTVYQGEPHPNRARLFTVVEVDGRALTALIDSGAELSTLTTAAAARLGLAEGSRIEMTGADGRSVAARLVRAARVAVGADARTGVELGVADIDLGRADILLGHDLMAGRRLFVSFATGWLLWGGPG